MGDFDCCKTEPPHLDPFPWLAALGARYSKQIGSAYFRPRPADENGKPYSQARAEYRGMS